MYAQNEQIHVAAWPSFSVYEFAPAMGAAVNNAASQVYAVEGSCFVLAPCNLISPEMVEMLCDTLDKHAMMRAGGGHAVIYGPDGGQLAPKLGEDEEGLVLADLDFGAIAIAKASADPAGHYSRPDVTRLLLDDRRAARVERFSAGPRAPSETEATPVGREESDPSAP